MGRADVHICVNGSGHRHTERLALLVNIFVLFCFSIIFYDGTKRQTDTDKDRYRHA